MREEAYKEGEREGEGARMEVREGNRREIEEREKGERREK